MKLTSILVIQYRAAPEAATFEQNVYRRAAGDALTIDFVDIFDDLKPWDVPEKILQGYDGVILGGSGELFFDGGKVADSEARRTTAMVLKRSSPLVEYLFQKHIPALGVCFGHQVIAAWSGGEVVHHEPHAKTGTFGVRRHDGHEEHALLRGLPDQWLTQYGHKDTVASLPRGATVVASGEQCPHAMLSYGECIHTTQFHPELDADDIRVRLAAYPEYLPEGKDVSDILQPSPHADQILKNFFLFVKRSASAK